VVVVVDHQVVHPKLPVGDAGATQRRQLGPGVLERADEAVLVDFRQVGGGDELGHQHHAVGPG
jgi:hypothetical protein